MEKSTSSDPASIKVMRLSARIIGLLIILITIAGTIVEAMLGGKDKGVINIIMNVILIGGLGLAWKWEIAGAVISITGFIGTLIVNPIAVTHPTALLFYFPSLLPSILFLICGISHKSNLPKVESPVIITKKKLYFYLPITVGVLTPSLVIFILEVFWAKMSPFKSVLDILHQQFAAGQNLFLIMIISLIPYAALILLIRSLSETVKGKRLDCIFWGGFIAVFGLTLYAHFDVRYPFYAGMNTSSTAAVAFFFIPIYCIFLLGVGLLMGWLVSFLPFFRNK